MALLDLPGALARAPFILWELLLAIAAYFIDAGYLFSQGSALLAGRKIKRSQVDIDIEAVRGALYNIGQAISGLGILRYYWYDGAIPGQMSPQHRRIAEASYFKLRVGLLNNAGRQKGVDSLIVTDLIELARNGAIHDAILIAGDEDLRVGVSIAQSLGIRVHLVGIKPSRVSQSELLRMEADTCHEWGADEVAKMLKIQPLEERPISPIVDSHELEIVAQAGDGSLLERYISQAVEAIGGVEFARSRLGSDFMPGKLPPALDRPLFGKLRTSLNRDLSPDEKRTVRRIVSQLLLP